MDGVIDSVIFYSTSMYVCMLSQKHYINSKSKCDKKLVQYLNSISIFFFIYLIGAWNVFYVIVYNLDNYVYIKCFVLICIYYAPCHLARFSINYSLLSIGLQDGTNILEIICLQLYLATTMTFQ